jgi:hypothetical protein
MILHAHHQMMMRTASGNAIQRWFDGGGLGCWYHVHPDYCFTDTAGTTHAATGQTVMRIEDRSGGGKFLTNSTSASCPVLQFDSTLNRYYLDFTSASVQRLGSQDSQRSPTGAGSMAAPSGSWSRWRSSVSPAIRTPSMRWAARSRAATTRLARFCGLTTAPRNRATTASRF